MKLKNKRAFISGASSGIGRATALALASQGVDLVLLARRQAKLQSLAAEIKEQYQVSLNLLAVDICDFKALKEKFDSQPEDFKNIDFLINNAGKAKGLDPIWQGKLEHFEEMVETNILGLLYLTKLILPAMVQQDRGHIVNIGSVAGHWVYPKGAVYCSTKYAVKAINEGMRLDLNGTKVRVTAIDPGMVETEFSEVRFDGDKERAKTVYQGLTPLAAEDVAEAIVWSLSRPEHVNVQTIILYPTDQASVTQVHRRK